MRNKPGGNLWLLARLNHIGRHNMKKTMLIVIAAMLSTVVASAQTTTDNGREIVGKSWQLYRQSVYEIENVQVVVTGYSGRKTEKAYTRWILFEPNGEDKTCMIFGEPAMDRGLGLLVNRHPGNADDLWLKLPSFDKVRRISVGDESKYFAGTDFSYEDARQLTGERLDDFDYQTLECKEGVWAVEARSKPGIKSGYGKRVFLIDRSFITREIRFYDQADRLVKTLVNKDVEAKEGGLWRAGATAIENVALGRTTVLRVVKREFPDSIEPSIFTTAHLTKE
ncbi:MAG: outer membrane lipoprotein-sorting protein [Patescibacteria group bacterium]